MSKVVLQQGAGGGQKGPGDGRRPRPQIPSASREGRAAFPKQVWEELKKTTWPTRDELLRMTGIVIATVLLFSLLIGIADFGLGRAAGSLYTGGGSGSGSGPSATGNPTPRLPSSSPKPSTSASPSASHSATSSAGTTPTATPSPH